jgi:hypothetical protein
VQAGHGEKPQSQKNQPDKNLDQCKPSLTSTRFLFYFGVHFSHLIPFHVPRNTPS